jgi:hypothetical protein
MRDLAAQDAPTEGGVFLYDFSRLARALRLDSERLRD